MSRRARMFWPLTLWDEVLKFARAWVVRPRDVVLHSVAQVHAGRHEGAVSGKVVPTKDWRLLPSPGPVLQAHPRMFARRHGAGVWYVLRFRNPHPQDVDQESTCDVRRLDLSETNDAELKAALHFCGLVVDPFRRLWVGGPGGELVGHYRDDIEPVEVACANRYGLGVLLCTVRRKDPSKAYGDARRIAARFMSSPAMLDAELDRILEHDAGSYLRGLGIRLTHMVETRRMDPAVMPPSCTMGITHPSHYWRNGSCKCANKVHRSAMRQLGWVATSRLQHIPVQPFSPEVIRPWR